LVYVYVDRATAIERKQRSNEW